MCHRVLHTYCARLAHGIGREAFRDVSDVVYVVHMYGVSEVTSGEAGGEADQAGLSRVLTFGCRWRVRPGTDLSEGNPVASSSNSDPSLGTNTSLLTRQHRKTEGSSASSSGSTRKAKHGRSSSDSNKNIAVCDELGFLPPIVVGKDAPIMNPVAISTSDTPEGTSLASPSALTNLIINRFRSSKSSLQNSMESRNFPLNEVVNFDELSNLVGSDGVVTFLLLKGFELKVKIIKKDCCMASGLDGPPEVVSKPINSVEAEDESTEIRCMSLHDETQGQLEIDCPSPANEVNSKNYWCFLSHGLERLGQEEVLLVLDRDEASPSVPRDVFKIYLIIHELALRRQTLEHLGNLLFQDGLFGFKDTAGLLLVRPPTNGCIENLVLPNKDKSFLVALLLQRWEVPWSKVFPMRLLLRLGYKYGVYPYPVVSFRTRDPVYYEIGHTIISILGDFRNFRYSLTHVDGLRVTMNKSTRKVLIRLAQSNYNQFNKVLDSSNNEHVLAWSSCPFPDSDGHLVCTQNEDGQYETVDFLNRRSTKSESISFNCLEPGADLGASFVVFSGALKVDQTGQPAKISVVEDGLLIQIQSCTMSALKNAIHFMHHFDIDCENSHDVLNRVEIEWLADDK